jgi:hypothetical protein
MDEHYKKFVTDQEERVEVLEVQGEAIDDTKEGEST